jgi:shikimate kinase
VDDSL